MDVREKLDLLGQAAHFDDYVSPCPTSGARSPGAPPPVGPDLYSSVTRVQAPGGRRVPVLKLLQTSACQNDCRYCGFRAGRNFRREHLKPDELARAFDLMVRSGVVQGLFLSSGIVGTTRTMDEMLATVELVRRKYGFRGYVHLKLLPGAEAAHVERAVELADRVSTNLEAPTDERLALLAPKKRMADLVAPLLAAGATIGRWRAEMPPTAARRGVGYGALGTSTQFVVGPAGESDRELLSTAHFLYREARLVRAYYSAFTPVADTPLEGCPATDPRREFRLYQADWLLRFYGFSVSELLFDGQGQLDLRSDPKSAWASAHPERFPVEINRASLPDLLRVPGIGPSSARAIVQARRCVTLRELGDLRKLGARAEHAAPYILLAGARPPQQLPLPLG